MLAYLSGIIKERQSGEKSGEMILTVGSDAHGWVGYQIKTPDHPRYEVYIPGQRAEVYIYTNVREDALDLYGFLTTSEKNFFTTVLGVSGVGPKLALTLLSHANEASLIEMILSEDKASLTNISGVGKKTAERMILELRDTLQKKIEAGYFSTRKVSGPNAPAGAESGAAMSAVDRSSKLFIEAYLALQGLGYKEQQAKMMIEAALKKQTGMTKVEDIIKQALQTMV